MDYNLKKELDPGMKGIRYQNLEFLLIFSRKAYQKVLIFCKGITLQFDIISGKILIPVLWDMKAILRGARVIIILLLYPTRS